MRIISKSRKHFVGTHKGATIEIDRESEGRFRPRFYITVRWKDGGLLYDGLAPKNISRMRDAKREAVRVAQLDQAKA